MSINIRTTAPKAGNKYYNTDKKGGFNPCIIGNYPYNAGKNVTGLSHANVLPNCVGYTVGAFNEEAGYGKIKYNLNTDAKKMFDLAKTLGLKTGKTPKLGAIIVWGNSAYGHVGIVTRVISATEIEVTQSGWSYKGATGVWTAKHQKGSDGNWIQGGDFSWMNGRYKFTGFIYNPDIKDEDGLEVKPTKVSFHNTTLTVQAINKDGENYIRLRDFEEVLHLCAIGYYNKKVTINGKEQDLTKLVVINKDGNNYIRLKDMQTKLKLCTVDYDAAKKMPVITVK